jgi:hypothetical protein
LDDHFLYSLNVGSTFLDLSVAFLFNPRGLAVEYLFWPSYMKSGPGLSIFLCFYPRVKISIEVVFINSVVSYPNFQPYVATCVMVFFFDAKDIPRAIR